jgi:hypothetical protein
LVSLISFESVSNFQCFQDPKRGNQIACSTAPILVKLGGSPDLKMAQANTLSLGGVLTPMGNRGIRLALDYSKVRRSGDPYTLDRAQVLANEDQWPERVVRGPLSAEDRVRGFTGGPITMFDGRATNGRSRSAEALDGWFEWPIELGRGKLRAYGAATLQMSNVTKGIFEPSVENVGYRAGPLKWRGNAGVDWTIGETSIGANVQYFGRYRIIASDPLAPTRESNILNFQGSSWVSSQAYIDLYASHRFRADRPRKGNAVTIGLGINNLLDKAPSFETRRAGGDGVSRYGDPRRRRLELTISTEF